MKSKELKGRRAKNETHKIWKRYLTNKTSKDYTTLYIHIPYCSKKCAYCEYFSKVTTCGISDSCIDYLEDQFKEAKPFFKNETIKAINFGGGTPNLLSPDQLDRVLKMIPNYWNLELGHHNEMGFEFQPYHMTEKHLEVLKHSYINRISMGVQSFDPHVIELEKRYYANKEQVRHLYNSVHEFARMVNVDLLAGLFDQTSEILINDVRALMDIGVESITIYELNRVHGRSNPESERDYITKMFLDMFAALNGREDYRYVGTRYSNEFMHCNRYYRKDADMFEIPYNPSVLGFNNVVAFNIDDDISETFPYSHFSPINIGYQKTEADATLFYNLTDRADFDHPEWKLGLKRK
jgi:hypothetical protein